MKRAQGRKVFLNVPGFKVDKSTLPTEDPQYITPAIKVQIPAHLHHLAEDEFPRFRTDYSRVNPHLGGNFIVRMPLLEEDPIPLEAIISGAKAVIDCFRPFGLRFNASFALIMEDEDEEDEDRRFRLAYASANNFTIFHSSRFVHSSEEVFNLLDDLSYEVISDHIDLCRESTKITIRHIAAVCYNALLLPDATQFSGSDATLPIYLRMRNLYIPPKEKGFCIFFCLARFFNGKRFTNPRHAFDTAKHLAKKFCLATRRNPKYFDGTVSTDDLPDIERVFFIQLLVFNLKPPEPGKKISKADVVFMTRQDNENPMVFLNSFKGHMCLIHNLKDFMADFRCPKCDRNFTQVRLMKAHIERNGDNCLVSQPNFSHNSLGYRPKPTLEDSLRQVGIPIPSTGLDINLIGTWDIETLLVETQARGASKMQIKGRHSVVCISASSNIPGYKEPKVFIDFRSEARLVEDFMLYIRDMSNAAHSIYLRRHKNILDKLDSILKNEDEASLRYKATFDVKKRFEKALRTLPVFSAWGGKFDVPVIISLMLNFYRRHKEEPPSVVKNQGRFLQVEDNFISLRDVASIQACSLDSFLNCWGQEAAKLLFPFDLMHSEEFLNWRGEFPPRRLFASKLRCNELPSEDLYNRAKKAYEEKCGSDMRRYYHLYAATDVAPLVLAISNMRHYFYSKFGLNVLQDGLTISAIAEKALFKAIQPRCTVILAPTKFTQDLNMKIRSAVTGGYSAIHHRCAIAGMTGTAGSDPSPIHQRVLGYDCKLNIKSCQPSFIFCFRQCDVCWPLGRPTTGWYTNCLEPEKRWIFLQGPIAFCWNFLL